jgi:PAS domain S-box-containing protein
MNTVFESLFDTTGFRPRGECGIWSPEWIWLHVASDIFIWLAYMSIPLVLVFFARRRTDLPFRNLFWLFASFILACGFTHFIDAILFYIPVYHLSGVVKLITAIVSWLTVIVLIYTIPRILNSLEQWKPPADIQKSERSSTQSHHYIVAILIAILSVMVRYIFDPLLEDNHPYVISLIAVVFVAWYGGFFPALVTLSLSTLATIYFFLQDRHSLIVEGASSQIGTGLFVFGGVGAAMLGEAQRRARRRIEAAYFALQSANLATMQAKQLSEESLGQLDAFVQNAPYGIAFFDLELRFIRVNRTFAEANGFPIKEHLGRKLIDVLPHFPSDLLADYREVLATGVPLIDRITRTQAIIWQLTVFPVRGVDGRTVGLGVIGIDVTDRFVAETRLRESESRFRNLAESMPQIVWMTRPDGYHEYYNARWYEYTGMNAEESIGWGWSGPLHPEDQARSEARWKQSTSTGEPYEIQYRFRGANGTYRWFLGRANPVRDPDGKIVRWLGTCTDIEEQVRSSESLQESRRFLESILHSLPSHLVVIDAEGTIIKVNESWSEFGRENGVPHDYEWLGKNYFSQSNRIEEGAESVRGIQAVIQGDETLFQKEYSCHSLDKERFFLLRATRFRGQGPVRVVLTHENITDRVIAERQVRESADQLRQLAEGLPQLMWSCTPEGRCDYLSPQWVEYTGTPEREQLGFGWLDKLHPDDREVTAEAWGSAVRGLSVYDVEYRIRRKDGVYRWFAARGIPLTDEAEKIVKWYGTCTDIDDRKREAERLEGIVMDRTADLLEANEALQLSSELLQQSNEELEKFAYIASHDLQEPLRKIQAFGDRLTKKYRDTIGDQGKDYLDRILDSARRMRRLIEDLLAFSRITTKAKPLEWIDLSFIVREVLEDLEVRMEQTQGRVEFDSLPTIQADFVQMKQLFQNLILNSLKFAKSGVPPVIKISSSRTSELPTNSDPPPPPWSGFRIMIKDNGIGFEQEYAERIFELFQRLHGRKEYEGTGLGLAIVRKIVQRHGGSISAKGILGEGATFIIDLPEIGGSRF